MSGFDNVKEAKFLVVTRGQGCLIESSILEPLLLLYQFQRTSSQRNPSCLSTLLYTESLTHSEEIGRVL